MEAVEKLGRLSKIHADTYETTLKLSATQQIICFLADNDPSKFDSIRDTKLDDVYTALYNKRVVRLNEMYSHIAQLEKIRDKNG
jgi:hypothetical protein